MQLAIPRTLYRTEKTYYGTVYLESGEVFKPELVIEPHTHSCSDCCEKCNMEQNIAKFREGGWRVVRFVPKSQEVNTFHGIKYTANTYWSLPQWIQMGIIAEGSMVKSYSR